MSMTESEARDPCLGNDNCPECPKYMDDCDGKFDEVMEAKADLRRKYGDD